MVTSMRSSKVLSVSLDVSGEGGRLNCSCTMGRSCEDESDGSGDFMRSRETIAGIDDGEGDRSNKSVASNMLWMIQTSEFSRTIDREPGRLIPGLQRSRSDAGAVSGKVRTSSRAR